MLGNLMRECGVVERLSKTVQNELMNICTIFLGISVGATTTAAAFLNLQTLAILVIGVLAFSIGSAGGVLLAKIHELVHQEQDQSADRFCRSFCSSDGSPRITERGTRSKSRKLPVDARHGAERGRSYRFCRCSRYIIVILRIT